MKIVLKNEKVELTLNTKGATVEKAVIKGYVGHNLQVKDGSADDKDVTPGESSDAKEAEKEEVKADEKEPEAPVVKSKNGRDEIPYQVLVTERERRAAAGQRQLLEDQQRRRGGRDAPPNPRAAKPAP